MFRTIVASALVIALSLLGAEGGVAQGSSVVQVDV